MNDTDTQTQGKRGRWSKQEHLLFLTAISEFGKDWKSIQARVPSRTPVQIRSHAQKYFNKHSKQPKTLYSVRPQLQVFKQYFAFLDTIRGSSNPLMFFTIQQHYLKNKQTSYTTPEIRQDVRIE